MNCTLCKGRHDGTFILVIQYSTANSTRWVMTSSYFWDGWFYHHRESYTTYIVLLPPLQFSSNAALSTCPHTGTNIGKTTGLNGLTWLAEGSDFSSPELHEGSFALLSTAQPCTAITATVSAAGTKQKLFLLFLATQAKTLLIQSWFSLD